MKKIQGDKKSGLEIRLLSTRCTNTQKNAIRSKNLNTEKNAGRKKLGTKGKMAQKTRLRASAVTK